MLTPLPPHTHTRSHAHSHTHTHTHTHGGLAHSLPASRLWSSGMPLRLGRRISSRSAAAAAMALPASSIRRFASLWRFPHVSLSSLRLAPQPAPARPPAARRQPPAASAAPCLLRGCPPAACIARSRASGTAAASTSGEKGPSLALLLSPILKLLSVELVGLLRLADGPGLRGQRPLAWHRGHRSVPSRPSYAPAAASAPSAALQAVGRMGSRGRAGFREQQQ